MKKVYIISALMIVAALIIFTTAAKDLSTYATFSKASGTDKEVKIAGQLAKDKEMIYEPEVDPNKFTFYIRDTEGKEHKVVLLKEKPQDFELSEQIVVTGKMKGDEFVARDILMKCPSKYKDEEAFLKKKG